MLAQGFRSCKDFLALGFFIPAFSKLYQLVEKLA